MSLQYIIDGYNVINHPLFNRLHKQTEDQPKGLLTFIKTKRLTGSLKNRIILVFDGYPKSTTLDLNDENVTVIYSRRISADEKIKMIIEEQSHRKNIVAVSDDRQICFMAKSLGARSIGIEEFIKAKEKSVDKQKRELLKPELSYSQMHKINQELSKIWLK